MPNYTVQPGDSSWGIAQKLGLSSYHDLGGLGSNANLIHPGQVLTYGASSSSPSPTSPSPSAPSGGGYSSDVPSGDPLLSQDMNSLNSNQNDLQTLAAKQAADLNARSATNQATIAGAYQSAAGQTGLQAKQDAYNVMQDAYVKEQSAANAAPFTALHQARGGMMSQADAAGTNNALQPGLAASNEALAMVPAENALNTAMQNTQNIEGNIVSGAQLNQAGFTAGQQVQLAALQSKISQGQALTNDEYQSYSALKSAQIGAAAQVQSAGIGAGATEAAARTAANASTTNTASTNALNLQLGKLANPGEKIGPDGNVTLDTAGLFGLPATGPLTPAEQNTQSGIRSYASKYGF